VLLKDKLESDTRIVFKVQDAIQLTGNSHNWLLEKAIEKNIDFLYKIPSDEVVYCLIPGTKHATFNKGFEDIDLSLDTQTAYFQSENYEYAVLSNLHYRSILLEGESNLNSFAATAVLNPYNKKITYTRASSFKDTYQKNARGRNRVHHSMREISQRNEFRIFKNSSPNSPQKFKGHYIYAFRPKGEIGTTVTVDDLWITRESLLLAAGETQLQESFKTSPSWANARLKALNLACFNYYNNVFNDSNKENQLKNFLKEKITDISGNALDFCVEIITESQTPKNTSLTLAENNSYRYPDCFPYCLINMNEVSRHLHEEYREKIENGTSIKKMTHGIVADKANALEAMPKRRVSSLASFMMPKI